MRENMRDMSDATDPTLKPRPFKAMGRTLGFAPGADPSHLPEAHSPKPSAALGL